MAAIIGDADLVDMLLEAGASVSARDFMGHTALSVTAASGNPVIVQRLIDAGASVSIRSIKEDTPLHCFAEAGHPAGSGEEIWGVGMPHANRYFPKSYVLYRDWIYSSLTSLFPRHAVIVTRRGK